MDEGPATDEVQEVNCGPAMDEDPAVKKVPPKPEIGQILHLLMAENFALQ
jgi:hypothetical protein